MPQDQAPLDPAATAPESRRTASDTSAGTTPAPARQRPTPAKRQRTRTGALFSSLVAGAIVLILLLVFILENTQSVKISYFGATGRISLGVALLLAAVGGALLTGIVGAARVLQLRHRLKRAKS